MFKRGYCFLGIKYVYNFFKSFSQGVLFNVLNVYNLGDGSIFKMDLLMNFQIHHIQVNKVGVILILNFVQTQFIYSLLKYLYPIDINIYFQLYVINRY